MQFIVSGQRIAVENFVTGKLYTILWKNDTEVNLMCTSIGADCVVFQGEAPLNLFTLTMKNADTIDTIEPTQLGTTNYNNLINKPSINGVDLIGNKTSSALGIRDVPAVIEADEGKVLTAADDGSYSWQVIPEGTTDYTDLSNKPQINSVTLSGNLSLSDIGAAAAADIPTTPADIGAEPAITSENMLDADLVDDTSSTHKFATAAQLEQIETNKNNILSNWGGAKNLTTITGCTTAEANRYIINNQPLTLVAGEYVISFKTTATTGANAVSIYNNNNQVIGTVTITNGTGTIYGNISIAEESAIIYVFATVAETITDFMICTKSDWEKSPVYAPYAMTNVDLTATEKQNEGNILALEIEQKNKLDITKNTGITKGANLTYTINNDGSVTIVANNTSAVESLYFDGLPYISGNLVLSGCPIGGGENSYLMDIYQDNVLVDNTRDTGSGSGTFTLSNTTFRLRVRFAKQTEPLTITIYPMVVLSDVWAAGSTAYQQYVMTNAEITTWIKSHS